METRLVKRQIQLQKWACIFKDQAESGLTIENYCREHAITKDAYYYWLRKAREAAVECMDNTFVEINPPVSKKSEFTAQMTVSINGITLGVNTDTPKSLILSTIGVLRNA